MNVKSNAVRLTLWTGALAFLLVLPACGGGLPHSSAPTMRMVNVSLVSGSPLRVVGGPFRGQPSLEAWNTYGLQDRFFGTQCGNAVLVRGESGRVIHGRLIVYRHVRGQGPAGRGSYLVDIDETRIREASEGRLSMQFEPYRDARGGMYTGWVAVLSDRPISCGGNTSFPPCEHPGSDDDGDGWGWENNGSCRAGTAG